MRHLQILSVLALGASLAACGDNTPAPERIDPVEESGADAAAPVELVAETAEPADPLPPAGAAWIGQPGPVARRMEAPEGLLVEAGETALALSGGVGVSDASASGRTNGASLGLPNAVEAAASGRAVRVTLSARAPGAADPRVFLVAYTTREVGNSGWTRFRAGEDFEAFSFTYDVPEMNEGRGDYLAVLPDASGQGAALEIAWIAVEVIDREAAPEAGTE